jgi:hypothetical protein
MTWPPFHTLDLVEQGLLPEGWDAAVRALAEAPEREAIDMGAVDWSFAVLGADVLRDRLPWLWRLYHRALRDFAGAAVGFPLVPCNRLRAAITLNILSGAGALTDWHIDQTAVTAVLFATAGDEEGGGDLLFRDGAGREARLTPRPGLFVCFEGHHEHQVAPLSAPGPRLSLAMLYFRSATTDQQAAFDTDVYEPPV